jgi:histidinol phosphatase-like enzyme
MKEINSKIKSKLQNSNYFRKEEILFNNINLKKPNAILFDWENTIVQRKKNISNYREMLFELTDIKIIKLLELLKKYDIYTGIVSNKNSISLNEEIQKLGFKKFFNKILGLNCSPEPKPSIEMIIRAITDSKIEFGENIWIIGDSEVDMEFAKISLSTGILFSKDKKHNQKFLQNLQINNFQTIIDLIEYFYKEEKIHPEGFEPTTF